MHISLYHLALDRLADDPLTLRESDFAALLEFGGSSDEQRGRDAQKKAQLALLPEPVRMAKAVPLQTKAAAPLPSARPRLPRYLEPEPLAKVIATALHQVVGPLRARVTQLEATTAQQAGTIAAQAATIASLQGEVKGLGTLVARDAVPLPAPTLADLVTTTSSKH